jgi:FKBP-type peptidyl-prolyl cis-trans isomerase (trigger factor)
MATSLLHELLQDTYNFSEEDFARLSDATKRLLRAELYEALNRDGKIMPLLVKLIKDHKDDVSKDLFQALMERVHENYQQIANITQPTNVVTPYQKP